MLDKLIVNKFNCRKCNKTVKVNGVEDIIRFEKTCAECRVIDITGGFEYEPKKTYVKPTPTTLTRKVKPKVENARYFKENENRDFSLTRKESFKKTKKRKLTPEQRKKIKQSWDDKWDRECENRRMKKGN